MSGSDPHDDTSRDDEQFEKELLAQDRDVAGVDTKFLLGRALGGVGLLADPVN